MRRVGKRPQPKGISVPLYATLAATGYQKIDPGTQSPSLPEQMVEKAKEWVDQNEL